MNLFEPNEATLAVIFVIDAEDQQYYLESLDRMSSSVARLHEYNSKVIFDIFIHKEGYHTISQCLLGLYRGSRVGLSHLVMGWTGLSNMRPLYTELRIQLKNSVNSESLPHELVL